MSKNVLIISSSPRKGGNSDTLCDQFYVGALDAGNTVEKIFLADKTINYCKGCNYCYEKGVCIQKDDAAEIQEKMVKADVLVFASPVYFYSMSGQLKTFIDRCCTRYTEMSNKEIYMIFTAADGNAKNFERIKIELEGFLACLNNPVEKGILNATGVFKGGDIYGTEFVQEAYKMGKAV